MKTLPQYFHGNSPIVAQSYCVVADLLGFSRQVLACKNMQDSHALCQRIEKHLEQFREYFGDNSGDWQNWEYQFFSDTMILAYPIARESDCGEPELGGAVDFVEKFQMWMVTGGFLVRGGFTLDELHAGPKLWCGKALVSAHEIEKQKSTPPRIVCSDGVASLIYEHLGFYSDPGQAPHTSCLLVDSADERVFVNYLNSANYADITDTNILREHRATIANGLSAFANDDGIRKKYEWAADYHNYFCETFIQGTDEYWPSSTEMTELAIPTNGRTRNVFRRLAERKSLHVTGKSRPPWLTLKTGGT